jgi:DnaJ-class molecular chaperone
MEFRDYYKTLSVDRSANQAQIKAAYRKLARKHHPDVNPNNKDAERRFKEINEAYQVIGDPEKRKKYDRLGADWERGEAEEEMRRRYASEAGRSTGGRTGAGGFSDFSDFFESFFSGGSGAGQGARAGRQSGGFGYTFSTEPPRAPDVEAAIQITLEDAVRGARRRVELNAEDECDNCQGQGVLFEEESSGKARVIRAAKPCPKCGGTGVIRNRRTLEITIPPGVTDGTRMRLKGQGGRAPRPELNGDLYITIRLKPHPVFTVSGRDLKCELPVWDYEAVLGAEVTVPTIGARVSLKIPARSQTGRVLRIKGRGLPARGKEPAGDLLFEVRVLAPNDLTEEERGLFVRLADSQRARKVPDPRAELFKS